MNDKDYLRDNLFKEVHAWEDNRQMIPFQPTALTATSSQDSPYFMDYKKLQEQKEYERKIKSGQIFPKYLGNNQFAVENNPFADTEAFVESGPEWQQKVVGRSGWNEQLNKGVDATLNFLDGKSNTYNWNPSVYGDPSNAWNEWSYWGEVGTGITKIFSTPENRIRMQSMLDRMDQRDPNFDEATRLRLTDEFLKSNPEVARYLGTAGVDLYDYTAGAVSDLGLRFRIHQAVVDSSQNVKLGEFSNTYKGYQQVGEALKNGIADPSLVRDLAITTALTFGLGTIQVGSASLAKSLGQASVIGARAMSVARASSKALQLTSPFTGLAEGVAYAGIRAAAPTVGKSALATTLARTGAIATEASLQSVLAAYGDQRHEYEWRNLIFRGQDDAAFKPDWQQVALQGAIGAGLGTAMMGVMRFAVGGIGDLKFISKGGWESYKKNVAGSLDTWARTTEGLTVWGDRLSQGRGVLFGDMVDNYMARSVDNRNLSNIMVNGQRLFSRTVFNPTVAAKASFNMDEASKFANTYAETLGLPAEYVQGLSPTSVERVLFDNLTDPEYLSNAGLTYKEASEILQKYKDIQDKVAVLPEADPVMAKLLVEAQGNPKLAAKLQTDNRLLALADIFDIDYVNKQLQRAGVSFDTVNNLWKTASGGSDLNLGNKIDRDAYRELGRFAANGNKWAYNIQERLKYIDPIRSTPLKVGDAEIDADTLRTALRAALDLDGETRKGRSLFLTDGFLDKDPTGIVEITPDGIVKVHRVTPEIGDDGKIVMRSDAFDHPDYKPENIKGIDSVNQTFDAWKNNVMVELKKLEDEAKVKVDEEIEESVPAEVFAELGKAPTKQVLMRHFDLSGPEATVASMVMETLGLDIKKVVLKIIRAKGKTLQRMEAGKAVGAIEWRDIKSGVAALISTSKGADFGTLVHEMGHYNRMLFIGDSSEHVEFRHKLGITDDAWKQFTDWLGYDGPWENDVTKMTPEQRKAEEKFANAWAYYIRSIMFGDGKTNDSSLHRLFSAFGDHLGEMGKKMQTQDAMDKTMNFDVFAKAVYDKLFLRSEGRVTEFWESAVNGVFKNMPQADRERLGEAILGTELWNSHKAKIQKDKLDAEAKIAPLTPKVTRVSRSDIAKSLKGKMSGEGLSPSQKSIRAALKDGKSLEDIEKETRELWARLQSEDQSAWEDNPALRPTSDMAIKGHVADLTDAQLLALPEGRRLKPINGVVRLVYNPDTKRMDVGFPVLIVTKDKINREIISRKARADALKRLRESRPKAADPVVAAKDITSDPIIEATTIDVPSREEPTNVVEGIPSTEQTIVHDVVDAVASANLGVREPDGTPVLEVTPDEAVEHTMQITQQETVQESLRDMNEVVPSPSNNESVVIAQAVTVRDNARTELEALQQSLPVQVSTRATVAVAASRANDIPVDLVIRELLEGESLSADMIRIIEDYRILEDRFINIMNKTEGLGDLTQENVDAYSQLSLKTKTILEEASVFEKVQAGVPIQDLVGPTKVSLKDIKTFVDYTTKRQTALKRVTERKLQKQLSENKKSFDRYTELQSIENKTPEQLAEIESTEAGAGKYRSAAEQLGLMDAEEIVRQRIDEDFSTFILKRYSERIKTEPLVGRAKPNTIKTDEDFAIRILASNDIANKLLKVKESAGRKGIDVEDVTVEQLLSNIYRDGDLIGWFKKKLNAADVTNEEAFNMVLSWARGDLQSSTLSKGFVARARNKAKENAASLKGTKKQVSSGERTEEGVGIFEQTESKELTDRSDQAADALISLFVDHLQGKESKLKKGKGTLSLVDYFMARRQLAEVPGNKAVATAKMIKEATGIEISEDIVGKLAKKIEKEADIFFKDIVDDPEIGNFAKELIDERFGIKVRKTKEKPATTKARELLQSPLEIQVGNDLRKAMHKGEVKNAKDALDYIARSETYLSPVARFIQENVDSDVLKSIKTYLLEENVRIRSGYTTREEQSTAKEHLSSALGLYFYQVNVVGINNNVRGYSVTATMLHEIIHGLTHNYISKNILPGFDRLKTGEEYLDAIKEVASKSTGWKKNLLTSYIEVVEKEVDSVGMKLLNDNTTKYWNSTYGYGLLNLDEYLSESFSNWNFQEMLFSLGSSKNTTKWSYADVFGWQGFQYSTAMSPQLDVLAESMKIGLRKMSKVRDKYADEDFRLMATLDAFLVKKFADAAKRVNKNDPLLQSQKAIADLKASKGRLYQGLRENAVQDVQPLIDAVDLRRRKLKELGLNEEMDAEELNMIGRILNGLDPVDVSTTTILDRVGSTFTPSQLRKISSAFDGTDYRSLSDNERRTFILESVIPKIRVAMGDRNSTNGFYSAFSSSDMGKRVNSLIGGAVDYGDTADSNSVFIQFISKIFDPLMDLRDGEIKNKFEMPSVDRINAERSNIMLRTGLTRFTDKVAATVKDFNSRKAINDTAWSYLTRPEELPKDIAHRDLILEAIQVVNEFNRIRVELLQSNKMLSKKLDYKMYGTSHRANRFAEANQAAFVDAMNAMFVKRTRESNQISIVTAAALGWVDLKRNTATDDITAIRIAEDSPLAKLMPEEKLLGKWVDWEGRIRKAFDDKTILPKDIQDIHDKGLVSIDDYAQSWKDAYASKVGKPYTALRQAAEIAKNRYLGIDFGDSKSSSPRRQSIGEGRNYTEERIFTHDEIVRDPNLSKFFRNDMFGLMNDDINTQILDAMMTRDLTKFFGARMTMTDLMEILATTGEEITGRQGISQAEVESRVRGYERLRNSWNRAIGIIDSDKDSIDKYAKVVLQNSRIPLTLASSLRAAVTSLPELARALLTSNKNKPMLMQFLPNMVKLAKGVGKNRRQARYQIMSGTHWLRGLATDHILLRESMDPENPFGGTVFGENAGGMAKNFVNGWRVAGERNKYETNWLQRLANRVAPVSSAVGAPLAFVNDMSTLLHIWNAQENITTNLASFRKMAAMLEKDSTTDMAKFADMARKCGLAPQEAINLSTTGLLKTKYIDIIAEAAKNQTLYSDGILDTSKLYAWAGENQERLEAITMMGGYINTTSRLTNVEPTLLDIRVGQSLFGLVMRQYMQFFLSMGVQEIGRRRRSTSVDYTKHLVGLLLMEVVAYGTSRALADPMDDNKGGIDEFEKNPLDYTVRTLSGLPLLGTYAWLSQVMRHTVMGASELMGGPGAEQEFRFPDLLGGPASSAPRRLGGIPDTAAAYYQALQEMISD